MIIELSSESSAYRRLIYRRTCVFPDPAAFCCIPLRCLAAMASATSARKPADLSISWPPPVRSCGRCCRSGRPATANRLISAFRRGRAIRCSSAWSAWWSKAGWMLPRSRTRPSFRKDRVDFERLIPWKTALLESAAKYGSGFEAFCEANRHWLDDFALFVALKAQHQRRHVGRNGNRARAIAIRKPWPSGASSWPDQSLRRSSFSLSSSSSGASCANMRARAACGSWATCRSMSRTIAPTSGSIGSIFIWTSRAIPPWCPVFRRITSARPASFGAIRFIAGTCWPRTVTAGGWIDFARRLRWWT